MVYKLLQVSVALFLIFMVHKADYLQRQIDDVKTKCVEVSK